MKFRFKRWYFGEVLLLGLAVFLLTVFTWFSIYRHAVKSTETSDFVQYNQGITVDQYEYLEDGRAIALSYHAKSQVDEPIITQNSVIFVEQSTHEDNIYNKRQKGDSLKVHIYQIGEKLGKPKTIDVLKLLEEKGYHNPLLFYSTYGNSAYTDGKDDYLIVQVSEKLVLYLNLKTHELVEKSYLKK